MNTKKIIMVDDNIRFRTDLRNYIEGNLGYNVIAEASNGRAFLELPNITYADIILMDIAMDEMDGFEATKRVLWNYPFLQIIAITMHTEKVYLVQLIETGFRGCVFKPDIYTHLLPAIEAVLSGKIYMPDSISLEDNRFF